MLIKLINLNLLDRPAFMHNMTSYQPGFDAREIFYDHLFSTVSSFDPPENKCPSSTAADKRKRNEEEREGEWNSNLISFSINQRSCIFDS